ncbi:MAG: hypothetical protein RMA76_46210 [Deltaproteobacteria bacterium]|jgi:hypothetical protein
MPFDFETQYRRGALAESVLDSMFSRMLRVEPVSRDDQRDGIDRVFHFRGRRWTVEYKTDFRAAQTGRVFIETVSNDRTKKAGWLYTSRADYLLYFVSGADSVYVVRMERLRHAAVSRWIGRFEDRAVPNRTYRTHGMAVPIDELDAIADGVICTSDPSRTRIVWTRRPDELPPRHCAFWTPDEDSRLRGLVERRYPYEVIARRLGRSVAAVRTRAMRLGGGWGSDRH